MDSNKTPSKLLQETLSKAKKLYRLEPKESTKLLKQAINIANEEDNENAKLVAEYRLYHLEWTQTGVFHDYLVAMEAFAERAQKIEHWAMFIEIACAICQGQRSNKNFSQAFYWAMRGKKTLDAHQDSIPSIGKAVLIGTLSLLLDQSNQKKEALKLSEEALDYLKPHDTPYHQILANLIDQKINLDGQVSQETHELLEKLRVILFEGNLPRGDQGLYYDKKGLIDYKTGNYKAAIENYQLSIPFFMKFLGFRRVASGYFWIAQCHFKLSDYDSCEKNIDLGLDFVEKAGDAEEVKRDLNLLKAQMNEVLGNYKDASLFWKKHYEISSNLEAQNLEQSFLIADAQRNLLETEKNAEIHQLKNVELKKALEDLKASQKSLRKREKEAAFGNMAKELAHEIQNPLNFVNNFSELSLDLVDEMVEGEDGLSHPNFQSLQSNLARIKKNGEKAATFVSRILTKGNDISYTTE